MTNDLTKTIQVITHQTQDNDHNGAITTMARYVTRKHNQLEGVDALVKASLALEQLHAFYGHMPEHLGIIREDIRNRVNSFLNTEESKSFHDAT